MNPNRDMRFDVIRDEVKVIENSYEADDKSCPNCKLPTVIGDDKTRRYCCNRMCNALIVELL